jgi:hypothetical protein
VISLQYLEDKPDLPERDIPAVAAKLQAAADRLPISHLLIGWHLPARLLEACRKEAERQGMRFMRWHPLLTGDDLFHPGSKCQVIGARGHTVPGYQGKPEFTFACPNHPEVQEALSQRMEELLKEGVYQGFFLDRIRFPSPAAHPLDDLGCFCEHCRTKAAAAGLDLEQVRKTIMELDETSPGRQSLVRTLISAAHAHPAGERRRSLQDFLEFRKQSVNDLAAMLCQTLRHAGMEIGLDCFSPSLACMVGQDLGALSDHVDWIKVMSYAHTRAPAGIPYELSVFSDYLTRAGDLPPARLLDWISNTIDLPLPATRRLLEKNGISSTALEKELRRGVQACRVPLLAGIELVQIEGVTALDDEQITSDLEAARRAGTAGLSISWDLWDIPLERLDLVNRVLTSSSL